MEGVMMRAPHSYCVAVRKPNGELVTEEHPIHRGCRRNIRFSSWPILRGLGTLGQAMMLGGRALKFSANAALDDGRARNRWKFRPWMMTVNVLFTLGVFHLHVQVRSAVPGDADGQVGSGLSGRMATNFVDGGIRIVIFLAFLFLLSRLKDIRRVFQYHGAEHKVVFNFESGQACERGERAEVHDLPSALRDQFPVRRDGDVVAVLSAAAGRRDSGRGC